MRLASGVLCSAKKLQQRVAHGLDLKLVVRLRGGELSHADVGFPLEHHFCCAHPVRLDEFDREFRISRGEKPDRFARRNIGRKHRRADDEPAGAEPFGEIDFAHKLGGVG